MWISCDIYSTWGQFTSVYNLTCYLGKRKYYTSWYVFHEWSIIISKNKFVINSGGWDDRVWLVTNSGGWDSRVGFAKYYIINKI